MSQNPPQLSLRGQVSSFFVTSVDISHFKEELIISKAPENVPSYLRIFLCFVIINPSLGLSEIPLIEIP